MWYLDGGGFAPTLPTGCTWARKGIRLLVRYGARQGRRLNALGTVTPRGPAPRRVVHTRLGPLANAAFLYFVCRQVAGLPASPTWVPPGYRRTRPSVIILDNYSDHHSGLVNAVQPLLERAGVRLYFLPPYSPELNLIEPAWRAATYEGLLTRSYTSGPALTHAVDAALLARSSPCRAARASRTYFRQTA